MDGEHIEKGIPVPLSVVRAVVMAVCLAEGGADILRIFQSGPAALRHAVVTLTVRTVVRPVVTLIVRPAARAGLRAMALAVLRATDREDEEQSLRDEQLRTQPREWDSAADVPRPGAGPGGGPVAIVH
jgi:hypothetical protein